MNQAEIDRLATRLIVASEAYYNGTSIVEDAVWDSWFAELSKHCPNHPALRRVGATPQSQSGFVKVDLPIVMTSLNKAQTPEEMKRWITRTNHENSDNEIPRFIAMDKLDGISVLLRYEYGMLRQAITRGDGTVGEDITRNVLKMRVPKMLGVAKDCLVRGEIVVKHFEFMLHFPDASNPRNTAAGTAKRIDGAGCEYLSVIVYDSDFDCASKQDELAFLSKIGFEVVRSNPANSYADIDTIYNNYITHRAELGHDVDGVVVTINSKSIRDSLGGEGGNPLGSIAYKFPHDSAPTQLRDIVWQVGATGRLAPVATFDAVRVGGVWIERASLSNLDRFEELRLFEGCTIIVSRRNDVAPYVECILDE